MCFTVILADDEPQILEGIRDSVEWETLGFRVIATALNGKELLEQTETLRPDLVISDIKMPFLDGLEVARILHENMMHIKIVLFSGWDDFEYAQLAIRYGVSEYVLKPIDFQEMQNLLKKIRGELETELEQTETLRPDLVISDIKMPFLDGLEVARILHENMMHIKIVLFSGWDDFEYAQLAIRYGVSEYVLKPIDFQEMQNLLKKIRGELETELEQRQNQERFAEIYQKSLPLLQEQFLIQLVRGSLTPEQMQRQQKNLSVSLDANCFCVVSMKITEESDDYLSQFSVAESVNEMLQQVCPFRTFRYLDKIIYLLLLSAPSEMIRIQKALNEASHISKHYNQVAFSCGIGSICEKLEDLPASFSQAMEALEYSVVSAEESVTSYQDVELYENHVYTTISTEELEMAIKLEDQEKVQKEVEKLVTQLEESHYNFNAYQSAILEIIFSISGIFRQYHMMDDEIFADAKRMTMKVLSLETGEQLNAWLLNYCDYIIYAIHQRKVDRNSILAQKAMEYVQQHYGNAELSVDEVCAYLHVSTSHFSNLFRKETGMSFLAFLTKKRMDEAVRLLKTTDEKSRVIGEMVGYPEPNYFSYVFKKNMGMSPAKFRKELATEN